MEVGMVKKILATAALSAGFVLSSFSMVGAGTLNRQDCEALGGTYTNTQGVKNCLLPVTETDPSGNSGNAWEVSGSSSQKQKGSIGAPGTSDTFEEVLTVDSCSNPGGNLMKLTNPHCQL
jgi:hypothetical protein